MLFLGAFMVLALFCFIFALLSGPPPEFWDMYDDERGEQKRVAMFKEEGEDTPPPTGGKK